MFYYSYKERKMKTRLIFMNLENNHLFYFWISRHFDWNIFLFFLWKIVFWCVIGACLVKSSSQIYKAFMKKVVYCKIMKWNYFDCMYIYTVLRRIDAIKRGFSRQANLMYKIQYTNIVQQTIWKAHLVKINRLNYWLWKYSQQKNTHT